MWVYPYKNGSNSAKLLAAKMEAKRIKLEGSKFKGNEHKIVLNWGASSMSEEAVKCSVINRPENVALAGNKLKFFTSAKAYGVSIPEFTMIAGVAKGWLDSGDTVVSRETLTGHSGEGIFLIEDEETWEKYNHNNCKMYVRYIPKKDEYRVHVVNGEVIDVRRKALKSGIDSDHANWKVRNHSGGFIFVKNDVDPPECVLEEAIKAIECVGLHFGAVDVVYNNFRAKAYVLEVNTAPGLEGSTVDNYKEAFEKFYAKPERTKVNLNDIMYSINAEPVPGAYAVLDLEVGQEF